MKLNWTSMSLACLLSAALSTSAFSQGTQSAAPGTQNAVNESSAKAPGKTIVTVSNLETAHLNELNLRDRYQAYAATADEEGYGQVASMFRAISRGEDVHASRLAALVSPGNQVSASVAAEPVMPMSTRENLESALAQQIQERDASYPRLLQQAQAEKNKQLLQTLRYDLAAEPTHLAWFRQALEDLDGYKGGNIDFYVCTNCGNTVRAVRGSKCEICGVSKDKFERVR